MIAMRMLSTAVVALVLVSASACSNAKKVAEYTAKAQELVTKYSPQLAELQGQLPDLLTRVAAIPDTVPGATALKGLLASNQETVAKLQSLLAGLPAQVTDAVKNRKVEDADAALASATQELDSGLASVQAALAGATAQIAAVEATAKEMAGFTKTLSSGYELHGATDGVESQLVAFIEDSARPIDKNTWFTFDRLTFQTGSADLDLSQSQAQIDNIAELMKAYPTAQLKIGGYTDNVGNAAANKTLSHKRAEAVVAALVASGVDKGRLEAEGYGQEHPVCPANDTEECKAQNRRIDVSVRAR